MSFRSAFPSLGEIGPPGPAGAPGSIGPSFVIPRRADAVWVPASLTPGSYAAITRSGIPDTVWTGVSGDLPPEPRSRVVWHDAFVSFSQTSGATPATGAFQFRPVIRNETTLATSNVGTTLANPAAWTTGSSRYGYIRVRLQFLWDTTLPVGTQLSMCVSIQQFTFIGSTPTNTLTQGDTLTTSLEIGRAHV